MVRWDLLTVWTGAIALGIGTWWVVLSWLGPATVAQAVAFLAVAAATDALRVSRS